MRKGCSALILVLTVVSCGYCFADNNQFPVKWTSDVKLNSINEIPQLLNSESYVGSKVWYKKAESQRTAATCNEYLSLSKAGYHPENNKEISAESSLVIHCDALVFLSKSRPAKTSYLRNFNLLKDFGQLPAAIIFPNLSDADDPVGTVKSAFTDSKATLKDGEPNYVIIRSPKSEVTSEVKILAWGDYNHDGKDDMLIFVANYVPGSTFHHYSTHILTRKTPKSPLIEL